MQFVLPFDVVVYSNKTLKHVLLTLRTVLLDFILDGLVSQSGQAMHQFNFIYKFVLTRLKPLGSK